MRNPYTMDDTYLYVTVPVISTERVHASTTFTASVQDYDLLAPHRWRVHRGEVVTLDGTTVLPLTKVILHVSDGKIPHQKDGNPMNYSRDNLRLGTNAKANEVLVNGDYAYLTLPDAQLVIIDSEDADRVADYYWKVYRVHGHSVVRTQFKHGEVWRKTNLTRFLLGYQGRRRIVHRDGDYLNCRKDNLEIHQIAPIGRPR